MPSIHQLRMILVATSVLAFTLTVTAIAGPPSAQDDATPLDDPLALARRRTPTVLAVESARPAVVYIETGRHVRQQDIFGVLRNKTLGGSGTGVVILEDGFIVTNYHVVKGADKITVQFDPSYDETLYAATLVSYVEEEDLALLKIEGEAPFSTVPMGTSSDLMIGEPVIAIGNPHGQTLTVSTGIVSGLHRNVPIPANNLFFDDLIQTDASINFGNSGGPLLNINGKLIGINSAMNAQAENIGFAIPVDRVKEVLEDRLLSPNSSRAWLGFELEPDDRLILSNVFEYGPAGHSGLRPGNRLLAIDGRELTTHDEYRLARLELAPGAQVLLRVEQSGRTRELRIGSWDKSNGILFERAGFTVEQVARHRGPNLVRVKSVAPDSPAMRLGLEVGDWIDAIRPLSGPEAQRRQPWKIVERAALAKLISGLSSGSEVQLDLYRDVNRNNRYERVELHQGNLTLR